VDRHHNHRAAPRRYPSIEDPLWTRPDAHLRPGRPPAGLHGEIHHDPLGNADFGPWSTSQILTWFVRLLAITDPTSPRADISVNEDVRSHSLAVVDEKGTVIGAINETMPAPDRDPAIRRDDPFLDAVLSFAGPIFELVDRQDDKAVAALAHRYPTLRVGGGNHGALPRCRIPLRGGGGFQAVDRRGV
jgi:hypothetical protein